MAADGCIGPIGTSGWQYRHWAGSFYPARLPQDRWLERYVTEFDTELNNPFYRSASSDACGIERVGDRLGPVLYQLPPRWNPNHERLRIFLRAIPNEEPQAVEFRDQAWYGMETTRLLEAAGVALCLHDMEGSATDPQPVGPFVYLRFHGSGQKYGGRYPHQRLSAWADRIGRWSEDGLPVWAYFKNDVGGHAFRDADRLRAMVARRLG